MTRSPLLEALDAALALVRRLDAGWPGRTVRWASEWVPDDALPLLARLGAIARAVGRP